MRPEEVTLFRYIDPTKGFDLEPDTLPVLELDASDFDDWDLFASRKDRSEDKYAGL